METLLAASIAAFLTSLLPLLKKALSTWLHQRSGAEVRITLGNSLITSLDIDPEQAQKIIDIILKEERVGQKDKPVRPESRSDG